MLISKIINCKHKLKGGRDIVFFIYIKMLLKMSVLGVLLKCEKTLKVNDDNLQFAQLRTK